MSDSFRSMLWTENCGTWQEHRFSERSAVHNVNVNVVVVGTWVFNHFQSAFRSKRQSDRLGVRAGAQRSNFNFYTDDKLSDAQCIFGFFPPNDRTQTHAQETPLLVLFLLAQKCLWTRRVQKCAKKSYFFEKVDDLGGSRSWNFWGQVGTSKVLAWNINLNICS
jgi:hypothetical protein